MVIQSMKNVGEKAFTLQTASVNSRRSPFSKFRQLFLSLITHEEKKDANKQLGLSNTPTALLQRSNTPLPTHNECPDITINKSDGDVPVILEFWGMRSTPSLSSLPCPLWSGVVATDRVLLMGKIQINCVYMLNWLAWNRTVLACKLRTYAKLNCLKWNCFCMLNSIVWNRTVFDI